METKGGRKEGMGKKKRGCGEGINKTHKKNPAHKMKQPLPPPPFAPNTTS